MVDLSGYKNNLTEKNCNYRLSVLYKERDKCSERIDKLICRGLSTEEAEKDYNKYVDIISELCNFRRAHNCAIEGDPDYECN